MLGTSETVRSQVPPSQRAAIRPYRHHRRSDDECRLKKAKQNQLNYRRRKAVALCSWGHCSEKAEPGRTRCSKHLRAMSDRAAERRNERIAQGLCTYCGARPQFWGRECIICRQVSAKDPLPSGAKRALRLHREAETRREQKEIQRNAREAALKLLANKRVLGKRAEALRLYVGIDNGEWRTYREVGEAMNLTVERVRQLLVQSKHTISFMLSDRVPWRPLEPNESNREGKIDTSLRTACKVCNNIALRLLDHEFYLYESCGLPNVVLFGLIADHCQSCNTDTVSIPRVRDLHRAIARSVLLKPAALAGRELRFLRVVTGLSTIAFAQQLGVAIQTIQAWEGSEALRYLNDLGARIVVAALLFGEDVCAEIFKLVNAIHREDAELSEIKARWVPTEARWTLTNDQGNYLAIATGVDACKI